MQRRDLGITVSTVAVLAVLLTVVTWRPTPTRHDGALVLYVVAAVLEAVALILTVLDLSQRARLARKWARSAPAVEGTSWVQIEGLGRVVLEILSGGRLAAAAGLLFTSLVAGTAANLLSASGS